MANLKTFTRALTVFCLAVLIYFFVPDSLSHLSELLKYIIIIAIIVILMMYNQILGSLSSSQPSTGSDKPDGVPDYLTTQSSTNNLYENLTSLVISTAKSINPDCKSAIYVIDPGKQVFTLQAGKTSDFADSIPLSNTTVKKYINKPKKLHQKDYPNAWAELFFDQTWKGSECAIFSPVTLHGTLAGFVLSRVDHFTDATDREMGILQQLGEFVSFGLENLESLEKHILGEDSKSLILEIVSNLDFKSDVQNIFNQFKYLLRTFFKYDRLTVSLRKDTENRRKLDKGVSSIIKLTDGEKDDFVEGSEFPTNGSLHGLPVVSRISIHTTDWRQSHPNMARFRSSEPDEYAFQSVLASPIIIEGESRGSIVLERLNAQPFSSMDVNDLELIGQVLGSALRWRYEYKKIHTNATHDGLSGLLNHQTFKERFSDEIQRAARFQQKMAVMIFDLDKFKKVNDTLGHQYGDYVIQTVSKILQDNVRAVDVVARYGGEEFSVILINTTAVMSNMVAKRIVDNIADYEFSMDGVDTRVTISGGMSEYPTHSENIKELIEMADQAMYATKQKGGNGIIIHNEDEKTGEQVNPA
tara:strand:- start:115 stop:1866 length:1752 start_codon:yes stop_codon:yes gene_type:complete